MPSKYVDTIAIMQVIGNVYNDLTILDDTDLYIITENDFVEEFHKIVFGAIYKLHELGAEEITEDAINDFLETRPKSKGIYNANHGNEYLNKISKIVDKLTFPYYYNRLKKMSLLRAYDNIGLDMSSYYDPDNILDLKLKEKQEEWLDSVSLQNITDIINEKIDKIRTNYVDNDVFGQAIPAGKGIEELITKFEESPDIGVPMYGNLINTISRGERLGKFYLRSAPTGCGKAIPNDTLIPTPTGWRKVGEIAPGDYLFGQNGKATKVLAIHPQKSKKKIWKVTFSDGRVAECCEDHLWEYRYNGHDGYVYRVESLAKINKRVQSLKKGLKASKNEYKFHIKLNEAVDYPEKKYTVHPYVIGALIASDSFNKYYDNYRILQLTSNDESIIKKISKLLGYPAARKYTSEICSYVFMRSKNPRKFLSIEDLLLECPELQDPVFTAKFIPNNYLLGSIEQRYELLRGLMDINGSIDSKGNVKLFVANKKIRDNAIELLRSLGMIAMIDEECYDDLYANKNQRIEDNKGFTINVFCSNEQKLKIFYSQNKIDILTKYISQIENEPYDNYLAIVDISETTEESKMTCFTVDSEDHLFLMNDFIVTHNTRSLIADACNTACNKIYYDDIGWIKNGKSFPTLFIGTEQDKEEIQTMMLAFLSNVNEENIIQGKYKEDERERVLQAAKILKESPLFIEEMPEFNLQDIENSIKRNIQELKVRYVFFDYIHSSLKILEEITKKAGKVTLREDNILFMLSARLKEICVKYGIFLMSATQLNGKKM